MRKIKIIEDGKVVKVPLEDIKQKKLQHQSLSDETLGRIKNIHTQLKDVLIVNSLPLSLEQFELGFMRDDNPENEILLWGRLIEIFNRSMVNFVNDTENRIKVFQYLIMISLDALTPSEHERPEVRIIITEYFKYNTETLARPNESFLQKPSFG